LLRQVGLERRRQIVTLSANCGQDRLAPPGEV
jgi:hypothetical protein